MNVAEAWATQWESEFVTPYAPKRKEALVRIFNEQQAAIEAEKAQHTAELREQAERFSEAAAKVNEVLSLHGYHPDGECRTALAPFILTAPDPLVEAIEAAVKAYIAEHGIEAFKALPMFGSAKIGEAGNER